MRCPTPCTPPLTGRGQSFGDAPVLAGEAEQLFQMLLDGGKLLGGPAGEFEHMTGGPGAGAGSAWGQSVGRTGGSSSAWWYRRAR